MERAFAILEAPSVLGLRPTGVENLPEAVLAAGLASKLRARHAGRVEPPAYDDRRDAATRIRNAPGIREYTIRLADAVERLLGIGAFPIVLGGDCSIILGNLLALRRRGHHGLLFVDGHADFYQPEANVNGEAASSELAFATGRGPAALTTFDGLHPLVRDEDVVVIGHRDAEEADGYGSQPLPAAILALDLPRVRSLGIEAASQKACARLSREEIDGFWIHVDADVLDDRIMPAVDYRLPGGLSWRELEVLVGTAMASGSAVGLDLTIFNPRLDEDGKIAASLADALARALTRRD